MNYKLHPYQENLCKEITMTAQEQLCTLGFYYAPYIPKIMKPKYQFSRANWYEAKLYKNVDDALDWCEQHFGIEPNHPDAWSRWYFNVNRTFRFRDEKDYEWFILRWS